MTPLLSMDEICGAGPEAVGGKAFSLAQIHSQGIDVPTTWCVPCHVYDTYMLRTRLKETIFFELNRKSLDTMRWEEIWDIALRIRNFFLTTPMPGDLHSALQDLIKDHCGKTLVAVRSSAPGEDDATASFAGLHDSFLNLSGTADILRHIRLVWASLYSDAALLYRRELGLDIHTSRMAVVIQEMIPSDRSGIFFGRHPSEPGESVIEAVYGLNQALVDGDIDPDRWTLHRASGRVLCHTAPERTQYAVSQNTGTGLVDLPQALREKPPLSAGDIRQIRDCGNALETHFGRPQDVEWTFVRDRLIILQARPITSTGFTETDDKRSWYLSLHRSHDNLKALYQKIEHQLIPRMIYEARQLKQIDLAALSVRALCREIQKRQEIYDHWVRVYWSDFIPFAHGIRLFGQVYNDAMAPKDPYEFMRLLEDTGLKSMERNQHLEQMAGMVRRDQALKTRLESGRGPGLDHPFTEVLNRFVDRFGDLSCSTGSGSECQYGEAGLVQVILEFAKRPGDAGTLVKPSVAGLKAAFLDRFGPDRQSFAAEILELGRESFRLRDDDNIHLGRIEARLQEAVRQGRIRQGLASTPKDDMALLAAVPALGPVTASPDQDRMPISPVNTRDRISPRQIVGHPAGPGIASGPARLIRGPEDLLCFKQGEILVCQGVDPNMTFVVPLAAGLVEERGGMLIHGAIIAREYGLPCITGASEAMTLIETGTWITVDGYLGIVTCEAGDSDSGAA